MASSSTWQNYRSPNPNKGDNDELLSMISDVVETIHNLERMYGHAEARIIVRSLLQDWHTLSGMAEARGLTNYLRP